jgi:hypothetical protein
LLRCILLIYHNTLLTLFPKWECTDIVDFFKYWHRECLKQVNSKTVIQHILLKYFGFKCFGVIVLIKYQVYFIRTQNLLKLFQITAVFSSNKCWNGFLIRSLFEILHKQLNLLFDSFINSFKSIKKIKQLVMKDYVLKDILPFEFSFILEYLLIIYTHCSRSS